MDEYYESLCGRIVELYSLKKVLLFKFIMNGYI